MLERHENRRPFREVGLNLLEWTFWIEKKGFHAYFECMQLSKVDTAWKAKLLSLNKYNWRKTHRNQPKYSFEPAHSSRSNSRISIAVPQRENAICLTPLSGSPSCNSIWSIRQYCSASTETHHGQDEISGSGTQARGWSGVLAEEQGEAAEIGIGLSGIYWKCVVINGNELVVELWDKKNVA